MKTREELAKDAALIKEKRIKSIETQIAAGLAHKQEKIEVYCSEEEYLEMKPEIEKSGFRTQWLDLRSRVHSPIMVIYL